MPVILGTAVVRSDGTFMFRGAVPVGAIGQHQIVVLGTSVTGMATTSASPITVRPAASTVNDLAFTGSSSTNRVAISLVLIALGVVMLTVSKRRLAHHD